MIIRPATVCGYAPRQRLRPLGQHPDQSRRQQRQDHRVRRRADAAQPAHRGHCDAVQLLLEAPDEKIADEIFNVGYQNMSIMDIAEMVQARRRAGDSRSRATIDIVTTPSNDNRSYHVNSDKIRRVLGFAPKRTIEDAVRDLCRAFKDGRLPNSDGRTTCYYNVRTHEERSRRHEQRARSPSSPAAPVSSAATWSICCSSAAIACGSSTIWSAVARPTSRTTATMPRLVVRAARHPRPRRRTTPLFADAELRLPLRRHRRHRALDRAADRVHGDQRPGHRARARMRARGRRRRSSSTPRRRPATAWPTCRRAKIIRSRPQYPYALSKYLGEQAVLHWQQVYRLPVNSIRIFNAYGPRVRTTGAYGAVFGVFFKQKLAGKPFTVVGDGTQRRDFLYVTDVARGVPAPRPKAASAGRSGTSAPAIRRPSTGWSSCSAARSSIFRSGRASPTAPGPTSARSSAISAGSRRCRSRRA